MAGRGGPTFAKRQREIQRDRKKRDKAERRQRRKAERDDDSRAGSDPEEDPDIAGIVPGPQPLPWEAEDLADEEE